MKTKLKKLPIILSALILVFNLSQDLSAQTQRNPVLEEFTGTWCQWCPCGHTIMAQIKTAFPNTILIGYHGPANGSDPFSFFSGNSVLGMFSVPYWPSGTVDRTGAPNDRGTWYSWVNQRNSVPATVAIEITRGFNQTTREFNATVDFTALSNLSGQYKYTIILQEDNIVWSQAGNGSCPGSGSYVHKHVVRDMMNGPTGEDIINGTWNADEVITKTISRVIPVPSGVAPDMVWDNCKIVVIVSKVGSAIYNSEIQQAIEVDFISPDYIASMVSDSPDIILANNSTAEFSAVLYNQGLLGDTYNVTASIDGPTGWTGEFTTINGTFPFGELDSVQVAAGDSTEISLNVNPNYFNGSAVINLQCESKNNPGLVVSASFNAVTNTGVHLLVVDATNDGYGSLIGNSLDAFYEGRYGIVSREAFNVTGLDLSYFTMIAWAGGNSTPGFYPDEVDNLESYLDQGGNLLLAAHNLGSDIFEAGGQSQFAQSFFNNYLHSIYVADFGGSYLLNGVTGDPITNGLTIVINSVYTRSPDEISLFDAFGTPIMKFGPTSQISSIRADNGTHKVVYFGFSFEQINDLTLVDSLVKRSVNWLTAGIVLDNPVENYTPSSFNLEQNYPNPFNPATTISYSIPKEAKVSLIIYDVMGREIAELVNSRQSAGKYTVEFDASSSASGTYFYKLSADEFVSVKKMVLLK